jgi:hypothetical protein
LAHSSHQQFGVTPLLLIHQPAEPELPVVTRLMLTELLQQKLQPAPESSAQEL